MVAFDHFDPFDHFDRFDSVSFVPAMRRLIPLMMLGLVLAMPGGAGAFDRPAPPKLIRLKVRPVVGLGRTQAPQTFEISLDCDVGKAYEGWLELKWYAGHALVHEFRSHEIALTSAGQRMRTTLPTIAVYSRSTNVTVYGRFLTERGAIDLGEVDTDLPLMTQRTAVVGAVQPQEFVKAKFERGISDSLGLEQFNPYADGQFDLLTYSTRATPEEMSMNAAGYAGFDLLVLEGDGFKRLRRGQMTAIGQWVMAGGSVVAAPSGELTAGHVEFLNRLTGLPATAGAEGTRAVYALDERGRLVVDEPSPAAGRKLARYYAGLGRAVIVHRPLNASVDFAAPEWREAVTFVGTVRDAKRETIARTGVWDLPAPPPHVPGAPSQFAPRRDDLARSIRRILMPERIVGMPFAVVAVILSLFLLAVAPGDYFLLGRFNCRKYTWWLFAVISATFTVCTVIVAEWYMGRNDYRTALVFVDICEEEGEEGRPIDAVARTSRFEMQFVSTQRMVEKPLRNCLYADLTDAADNLDSQPFQDRAFGLSEADELDKSRIVTDLPVYEGAMPGSFTVHQQLRQWSPRITRETTLSDDRSLLSETRIEWSALPVSGLQSPDGRQKLYDALLAREPEAQIMLLNRAWGYDPGHNAIPTDGGTTLEAPLTEWTDPSAQPWRLHSGPVLGGPAASPDSPIAALVLAAAARASIRAEEGLFKICSQVAPTGGQVLEDLALLDDSDPHQWLLIVAVRRDAGWLIFRKIFRGPPRSGGLR